MESIESVLELRKRDLVETLVSRTGLSASGAERFVDIAGTDLIEALVWRDGEAGQDHLAAPSSVRDVLADMEASHIAESLGLPQEEVWAALRTFVPRALEIADRSFQP